MQGNQPPPDQIAAAIAATEHGPEEAKPEVHKKLTITIEGSGRHVVLGYPIDMTDAEIFELVSWMTNPGGLRAQVAADAALPAARIVVPPPGTVIRPT